MDPAIENNHYENTPYSYVYNNPIRLIDPLGLDSVNIYSNGSMCIDEGSTTSNTYFYYDSDGNMHSLGTFAVNDKGLVQLPSDFYYASEDGELSFGFTVKSGNESKAYASEEAFGALIGAVAETNTSDLVVIGFSNADGSSPSPSTSHKNGKNGDLRYLKTDFSGSAGYNFDSDFDKSRQASLNGALNKFGWKSMLSNPFGMIDPRIDSKGNVSWVAASTNLYQVPYTTAPKDFNHYNHLHMQGFRPNVTRNPKP